MAKVTASSTIEWPKLSFVIPAGEEVELPENKEAQNIILNTQGVTRVAKKRDASDTITH